MSDILSHITDCIQYRKKKVKSVGQKNITLFMSGGGGDNFKADKGFSIDNTRLELFIVCSQT